MLLEKRAYILGCCPFPTHVGQDDDDDDDGGGAGTHHHRSLSSPVVGNGIQPAVRKSSGVLEAHGMVDAALTFASAPNLLVIIQRLWKI